MPLIYTNKYLYHESAIRSSMMTLPLTLSHCLICFNCPNVAYIEVHVHGQIPIPSPSHTSLSASSPSQLDRIQFQSDLIARISAFASSRTDQLISVLHVVPIRCPHCCNASFCSRSLHTDHKHSRMATSRCPHLCCSLPSCPPCLTRVYNLLCRSHHHSFSFCFISFSCAHSARI
jgi:hypothetical protein